MSISSLSLGNSAHSAFATKKSALQQPSTDFSALASALGSNNLTSAQNAFASLQKDAKSIAPTQGGQASAQTLQQLKSDAQTLATALGGGNLGAAQKAFATLKKDSVGAHLHAHHGGARVAGSSGTSGSTSPSVDLFATQAIGSVGSLNVTA